MVYVMLLMVPDGVLLVSDGTSMLLLVPAAFLLVSDGTCNAPDGSLLFSDGTFYAPDGSCWGPIRNHQEHKCTIRNQ